MTNTLAYREHFTSYEENEVWPLVSSEIAVGEGALLMQRAECRRAIISETVNLLIIKNL